MNRRNFIKNSMLFAGTLAVAPSLVITKKAYAAWPKKSFDIKDLTESVSSVYGHNNLEESSQTDMTRIKKIQTEMKQKRSQEKKTN